MEIGEKIKQLRTEKKLSQKELALKIGVTQQNVAYFENKGNTITIENAFKIATALEVSIKSLLFDDIDYTVVPNSKEVENLLTEKDKEIEDLRKENEKLKLRIDYETLLRTSKQDKINDLCWGYVKMEIVGSLPTFDYHANSSNNFEDILDDILSDREFIEKTTNKPYEEGFLMKYKKYKEDYENGEVELNKEFEYLFYNIESEKKYAKRILKEFDKLTKNFPANENFIFSMISGIEGQIAFEEHFLGFCLVNNLVSDPNLLYILEYYRKYQKEQEGYEQERIEDRKREFAIWIALQDKKNGTSYESMNETDKLKKWREFYDLWENGEL